MKSELRKIKESKNTLPFPKLMKCKNDILVVAFQEKEKGFVIIQDELHAKLSYRNDWDMDYFEDIPEDYEVVLRNVL